MAREEGGVTFEIITRWSSQTYHARWKGENIKATATPGHQWAVTALVPKLMNHATSSGKMKHPVVDSLIKVDEPKDYTLPVTWQLTLKEGKK